MSTWKRYGAPYQGSKNKIAEDIVSILPPAKHLYDLFAGGCAITHAAIVSGKFEHVHANDISDAPQVFAKAVRGEYADERRVLTREEFARLKDSDPFVRYCWAFGNNGEGYLFNARRERIKLPAMRMLMADTWQERRRHYLEFCKEVQSLVADIRAEDALKPQWIEDAKQWREKVGDPLGLKEKNRVRWEMGMKRTETMRPLVNYFVEAFEASGLTKKQVAEHLGNGMASHYFTTSSQWALPTAEHYAKLQQILPALKTQYDALKTQYDALKTQYDYLLRGRTENETHLEALQHLDALQRLEGVGEVDFTQGDYRDVRIEPDSVIYCDIPYKNTEGYNGEEFNHEGFYQWAREQSATLIISEYAMPDDFVCVWEKEKGSTFSPKGYTKATERLFVPAHQASRWARQAWKEQELPFAV